MICIHLVNRVAINIFFFRQLIPFPLPYSIHITLKSSTIRGIFHPTMLQFAFPHGNSLQPNTSKVTKHAIKSNIEEGKKWSGGWCESSALGLVAGGGRPGEGPSTQATGG
jgi:hypothetical protein